MDDNTKNNLRHWFPILQKSGVPVPDTLLFEVRCDLNRVCFDGADDEENRIYLNLLRDIKKAGSKLGWPCFVRTGYGSGKHNWKRTCYAPHSDYIEGCVQSLVTWSLTVDYFGLPLDTLVLRKFIQTDAKFIAFDGIPITKERRYFIRGGKVQCHHPYWPADSIEGHTTQAGWEPILKELNTETPEEVAELTSLAEKVSAQFGDEAWSLDFLQGKDNVWYAIDMALAEQSYHWSGCKEAVRVVQV